MRDLLKLYFPFVCACACNAAKARAIKMLYVLINALFITSIITMLFQHLLVILIEGVVLIPVDFRQTSQAIITIKGWVAIWTGLWLDSYRWLVSPCRDHGILQILGCSQSCQCTNIDGLVLRQGDYVHAKSFTHSIIGLFVIGILDFRNEISIGIAPQIDGMYAPCINDFYRMSVWSIIQYLILFFIYGLPIERYVI